MGVVVVGDALIDVIEGEVGGASVGAVALSGDAGPIAGAGATGELNGSLPGAAGQPGDAVSRAGGESHPGAAASAATAAASGDAGMSEHVGGAALNVAVGLAVLGVPARLIAMVGDDEDGAAIRRYLGEHGVELLACPAEHGTARAISRRVGGEPSYEFTLAARRRRISVDGTARSAVAEASHVVVSCFPLDDAGQTADLLEAVADRGRRLIIDPNPRAGMMNDLAGFREGVAAAASACRLIKIGDDDANLLYGAPVDTVAQMLLGLGAQAVLTTSGAEGAALYAAGGEVHGAAVAQMPGPVVDTMGAGDATVAAVTRGIAPADAAGVPVRWDEVLGDAMRIAAATCRTRGALLRVP